jgi:hypothetical protein
MNDSAIWLIGEVLLFRGMGVVDVLLLLMWKRGWGRYAELGRGCMVEGAADMCVREL